MTVKESKKPIGIVVDEAADLPKEIIDKYQIGVVPLNVHWPEIERIPGSNIYQKIKKLEESGDKSFAKTSQPSPKAFLDIFQKQLERFEKVICLTITSKHSGTYNSACQAKRFMGQEGNKIYTLDSLNASAGMGLIVLRTADLIEKGYLSEKIIQELEKFIPQVRLYIILEDPKRLEASGRMPGFLANWIRKLQKIGIRPLIGLKQGKLSPVGFKKGARDIPTAMFSEIESRTKAPRAEKKKIQIAITHGDNPERADKLKDLIEKNLENTEIAFVNIADDVLGTLVGPDCLVAAWVAAD